jgi:hypothetical protein
MIFQNEEFYSWTKKEIPVTITLGQQVPRRAANCRSQSATFGGYSILFGHWARGADV